MTARIALGVEYDGSAFHGWQIQRHGARTAQQCLQTALSKVAAHPVNVSCAGRTDSGVHASGQVVHFDTSANRAVRAWTHGVNANLPGDLAVTWAVAVSDDFHARFSATARRYRYCLLNRSIRSPLRRHRNTLYHRAELDINRMREASQALLGEHDFSSFRAAGCQSKTPRRRVHSLDINRDGEQIIIDIEANAFLLHMVRNLVGSLLAVGCGEQPPSWIAELLLARDRRLAGITARPEGLCLTAVRYPARFELPTESKE